MLNDLLGVIKKARMWTAGVLIGDTPYAANLYLIDTLAIDADKTIGGVFTNMTVAKNHHETIPDAAFYFASNVEYYDTQRPA